MDFSAYSSLLHVLPFAPNFKSTFLGFNGTVSTNAKRLHTPVDEKRSHSSTYAIIIAVYINLVAKSWSNTYLIWVILYVLCSAILRKIGVAIHIERRRHERYYNTMDDW